MQQKIGIVAMLRRASATPFQYRTAQLDHLHESVHGFSANMRRIPAVCAIAESSAMPPTVLAVTSEMTDLVREAWLALEKHIADRRAAGVSVPQ